MISQQRFAYPYFSSFGHVGLALIQDRPLDNLGIGIFSSLRCGKKSFRSQRRARCRTRSVQFSLAERSTWAIHKALLLVSIAREDNFVFPADRGVDVSRTVTSSLRGFDLVSICLPEENIPPARPYVNVARRSRSSPAVKLSRERSLLCTVLSIARTCDGVETSLQFAGLWTACRQITGTFPCNPRDLLTRAKSRQVYASGIH
jgi:hypothetical protein